MPTTERPTYQQTIDILYFYQRETVYIPHSCCIYKLGHHYAAISFWIDFQDK